MLYAAREARRDARSLTVVLGARTADMLVFEKELRELADELVVLTDDGSSGRKSTISGFMESSSLLDDCDHVYCCGPELMMFGVLKIITARGVRGQFSLERHMYCGIGGCGSCTIDGCRVCKDGPVFDGESLLEMPSFGRSKRTPEGLAAELE